MKNNVRRHSHSWIPSGSAVITTDLGAVNAAEEAADFVSGSAGGSTEKRI